MSRPPRFFSPPWHLRQEATNSGRTCRANSSRPRAIFSAWSAVTAGVRGGGEAARRLRAPARPRAANRARKRGRGTPRGVVVIKCYGRRAEGGQGGLRGRGGGRIDLRMAEGARPVKELARPDALLRPRVAARRGNYPFSPLSSQ